MEKKRSVYDKNQKGWRGPILRRRSSSDEKVASPRCRCPEGTETLEFHDEFDDSWTAGPSSSRPSKCQGLRISPKHASTPNVSWKQPPHIQHTRQRISAFEWERRHSDGTIRPQYEKFSIWERKESELLQTQRQENQFLLKELDRTNDKNKRMEQLVKDIAQMREDNQLLSRQIKNRKEERRRNRNEEIQRAAEASSSADSTPRRRQRRRSRSGSCPIDVQQMAQNHQT